MEDNVIMESDEYSSKTEKITFQQIVLQQVQRVVNNSSKEMKKGYWIYSNPSPQMVAQRLKYIGDSRRELLQSIDTLHDLLLPEFDKEMLKQSQEIYAKENEFWKGLVGKEVSLDVSVEKWQIRLKFYRQLFQQLCFFLKRIKWFSVKAIQD